jgi:hypothetical protein
MAMPLRECGEIRNGNELIVFCLGRKENGDAHCDGLVRIPFSPPLLGYPMARPNIYDRSRPYWTLVRGNRVDNLTLRPSISARDCGHFEIRDGMVIMLP